MNKNMSLFSQMVHIFPRGYFERAARELNVERHARGFRSWDQFVAMLFCQVGKANSLREITNGLASCEGNLVHLGMKTAPKRSTLAYANEHRSWELYRQMFFYILDHCQKAAARQGRKFRFKHKLYSLDSTTISLCAAVFPWAKYRQTKGAVKLHLRLDHDGYLPDFAYIREGKEHDHQSLGAFHFRPDSIYVFDRGYTDYQWYSRLCEDQVYFVTRLKDNADYEVVERTDTSHHKNIRCDQVIELKGYYASKACPFPLRRIRVYDPEEKRHIILLTNIFHLSCKTISEIYIERWNIEIIFKTLKQYLKIKTFVGTSENAVHIQIWTALIALLLLKFLKLKSRFNWSLSNLAALIRMNLFTHRDLWEWINNPFTTPQTDTNSEQLQLALT
jgi:hypothetical protein